MKNALWKTCIGGFITAVFCLAICTLSFGAEGKSIEEMEKELNALKASIVSLTEQIAVVKQKQEVALPSFIARKDDEGDDEDENDLMMLKEEVRILREEMKTAAQAEPTLKAEDLTGNVFSDFAKKVKLGGQIRTRAEYANGFYNVPDSSLPGASSLSGDRPRTSIDDEYVLQQTRLWADADVNEHLRVFIQLQDSRVWGAAGSTIGFATEADGIKSTLGLHQGYFDIRRLFDLPLTARVGRQEIIWGDHRLIGNFVWSNMGRTFDGARFIWDTDTINAEVFGAIVDERGFAGNTVAGITDRNADESVYAARLGLKKFIPGALLELMYILKSDQDRLANSAIATGFAAAGDGNVVIHNIGARLDGKLPNLDAVDYTFEAHGQFGDYGDLTHRAWAFAGRAGYTFRDVFWTPRFGLEYSFASGDKDPDDSHHGTFDNLYPTNHWQLNYGAIDLVSWQNIHDARANIKVVPTAKLTAQVDYHYFWLNHSADGWYFANGLPAAARPPGGFTETTSNRLAQEIDLTLSYDLYKNVKLLAGYSYFDPQTWIKRTIDDVPTHWGFIQATVTF